MPKVSKKPTTATASSSRPKRTTTTKQAASAPAKPTKKEPKAPKKAKTESEENAGTGFRDSSAAKTTIASLPANRSLTYHYQTISTLLNRATHHPHKTPGIEAAIAVFKEWLDNTYPAKKAELRVDGGFKPILSKEIVSKYFPIMEKKLDKGERRFAEMYVALGKGKKLGNVLVDNEGDWEALRYKALDGIVPAGKEDKNGWDDAELWDGKEPAVPHLKLIAWGWSPVPGRTLSSK